MSIFLTRNNLPTKYLPLIRHCRSVTSVINRRNQSRLNSVKVNYTQFSSILREFQLFSSSTNFIVDTQRSFSKKKKGSKHHEELEEESDEEEEEIFEEGETGDDSNVVSKILPSLRMDSVLKAAFGITKKKIEKEFYANKIRLNDEKCLKKATLVYLGDQLDVVKGPSPENAKFLVVDRTVIKSVGKVTGSGNFPIKMTVFKSLIIENYPDPWVKSHLEEVD